MPSTIQVRIAVAVDIDGAWCAVGMHDGECDEHWTGRAQWNVSSPSVVHILTATLPVPEVQEIEAKVEEVK